MKATLVHYKDNWQLVKDTTMNTIGKLTGKYPDSEWKRKLLLSEHSPIRNLVFTVRIEDLPYWVSVHLTRHKIGIEHFVSTQRTDRKGVDRNELPQNSLVNHTITINAQALITISRKRMCKCASYETRIMWERVLGAIREVEPELFSVCVPDCVYRGNCKEMFPCGFDKSIVFEENLKDYNRG